MSVSDAKPCATPGGMNTPRWSCVPSARAPRSNDIGRAVGRRADAQVVQHDARPAERHVPVVGLVQVVVQADDRSPPGGRRGSPGSSRARSGIHSRRNVSTKMPRSSPCTSGSNVADAGDHVALADRRPCATPGRRGSGRRASSRVACGRSPDAHDLDLAAEQRVVDAVHAEDAAAVEHDRVLDLGVDQLAVGADRRVRPDVGVDETGAGADDRGAAHDRVRSSSAPASMTTRPSTRELLVDVPVDAALDRVEHEAVAVRAAGPSCRCRSTSPARTSWRTRWPWSSSHWIASVISSSPRADGSIARTASWIGRVEEVHADEREVGRRVGRLLDEPHDVAVRVERGDAELARVVDVREQDLRGGRRSVVARRARAARDATLRTGRRTSRRSCWSMLSPRYIDEVVVAEEVAGDEHAVREPERRVLGDVGDLDAEAGAVADACRGSRRGVVDADDDADLLDPGRRPCARCRRRGSACWRSARAAWRSCA